jgi:hypothetical protein
MSQSRRIYTQNGVACRFIQWQYFAQRLGGCLAGRISLPASFHNQLGMSPFFACVPEE